MDELILSIDGGGTKTDVCIAGRDESGLRSVIGRARGGPANLNSLGVDAVIAELDRTIAAAAVDAGVAKRSFQHAIVGLAGGADEQRCREVQAWLKKNHCEKATVVSDAMMVLSLAEALGAKDCATVALLVGTGSVVFYRDFGSSETHRVGGWGPILGDEGGGYWIGREAIRRVLRAADDGRDADAMSQKLFDVIGTDSPRKMIAKVCQSSNRPREFASLAAIVYAAAQADDQTAMSILNDAARHIGSLVQTALSRMGNSQKPIVVACAGAVITKESVISQHVLDLLRTEGIEDVYFIDDPAAASVQLAPGTDP